MDQVQKFLRKLYRGVGSARAKRLERLVAASEWASLQKEVLVSPSVYQNDVVYLKDALVVEITRKLLLPGDSEQRRKAAIATFWQAESQCAATNARLSRFISCQGPFEGPDEALISFIGRWRNEIRRVLGRAPKQLTPRFSGGSTLSDKGQQTTIPDKLFSKPTLYAGVDHALLQNSINGTPFFGKDLTLVGENRFFTVPKDSAKDRGCCVEASLAVSLQLDVGKIIERRFEKAYQADLSATPDYHRWLSQLASKHGTFATIDLSNASDTVSKGLVKLLLDDDWYMLLNSLRAKATALDGQRVYLEKFSSMGNGFTFPLETLIFRSLAVTLGCRCVSVFGDDIIIETERSADMIAALRYFGFTPNEKKTFCDGPFRESCGGDFFNGKPVRAHYLKELPSEPQNWIALANGLRRVDPTMRYVRAAWHFCVDQVPLDWRNFTAESDLGDFAFYDPGAKPQAHFFRYPEKIKLFGRWVGDEYPAWRGKVPVAVTFSLFKHFPFEVAIVAASMGVGEDVAVRDKVAGYRTSWVKAQVET